MIPGIYYYPAMSMPEYLKLPAINASLLKVMLDECPKAAWYQSWLNPNPPAQDDTDASDKGSIAHELFLLGEASSIQVIDPQDHPNQKGGGFATGWTNNSIRAARDSARIAGKIPVLVGDMEAIREMTHATWAFVNSLEKSEPKIWMAFFVDQGESELTMVWNEGGTLCKIRPDRISKDRKLVIHYKTTSTSVEPDRWGRMTLVGQGHYVTAAWYRRGIRALCDVESEHVFLVQSTEPPYLCSLVGVDPAAHSLGAAKSSAALYQWQKCVAENKWPAYPNRVVYPEIPIWETAKWEERQIVEYGSQP